jgi:hypothetical protein
MQHALARLIEEKRIVRKIEIVCRASEEAFEINVDADTLDFNDFMSSIFGY